MHISEIPRYPVTVDGETTEIGTADELAIALDVLQGQRDREVLVQLRPHLSSIVGGPGGFLTVMRALQPADQLLLIEAMGPRLAGVLKQARYLRDVLAVLSSADVEQALMAALGAEGLRALIVTAEELAQVLEWIYGHNDVRLVDLLGVEDLRQMIRTGQDLSLVLNALGASAQQTLLDRIGDSHVRRLVTTAADLASLLGALTAPRSAGLLEGFSREDLIAIIGNRDDWAYLYQRLEPKEAAALLKKMGATHDAA